MADGGCAATSAVGKFMDALADLVVERFAARMGAVAVPEYTTKTLPAGITRRAFNERCKRLHRAGDKRVWKRGQIWVALRAAIDEAPSVRRAPTKVLEGPWSPQAALAAAAVRAQR